MDFLFFDSSGKPLFTRNDSEEASYCHEELSFQATFPYDPDKVILHGMRVGFTSVTGEYRAFEIRTPNNLEPEHCQEITGEHIAISELTDEVVQKKKYTDATAQTALSDVLTGTLWSVGNVTASNTSSADIESGYVWTAIRTIEKNWNVYITPRITVNSSGITGRYLDIAPAGGTWRGLRLSLEKNVDQIGVKWDDSNLKTALYGFGKANGDSPLTFANVVWATTADHPAKPSGQKYIEDPDATAAYGRNGRPRFGYYQNGDISEATILLEKTWETLKTVNVPDVSITSTVKNLRKMGAPDVPIQLHDTALVEIAPTNVTLSKEVIRYTEDLLNPLNDRLTIGTYIPNIIYINRRNGGGGGGSGGQNNEEYRFQYDFDLYESNTNSKIGLVVTEHEGQNVVNIASIVLALNASGSSVKINADHIELDGETVATSLYGEDVTIDDLVASQIETVSLDVTGSSNFQGNVSVDTINNVDVSGIGSVVDSIGPATASGGQITIPWTKLDGTAGTPINFNIADTQFYIDGVAAAETAGWNAARAMVTPPSQGTGITFDVLVPAATQNQQQTYAFTIQKGATPASSGYASVALSGIVVGRIAIGDWYDAGWNDCRDACTSGTYLSGYTNFNNGRSTELFIQASPNVYASVGNHVWRYGGGTVTRYSIPSPKS